MYKPDPKHIAYHEAGHVAAQLIFGQTPDFATIDPKETTLGFASHIDGDDLTKEGMRELVINCYAGREAEKRVGGDGSGSYSDDQQAEDYLQFAGTEEEMRKETAKFITEHWSLVERIANELLEYTTLECFELDTLLEIYRGKETEENLQEYRNSWGFQGEIEGIKSSGFKRGAFDDKSETI